MWYDKLIDALHNSPDEFYLYVYDIMETKEYDKAQLNEIFIELLHAIEVVSPNKYNNIIFEITDAFINESNDSFPWYGRICNIAKHNSHTLINYMNNNICKYSYEQIGLLLKNLTIKINEGCTHDERIKIYDELAEGMMWLYRITNNYEITLLIECGKYSLLSFDNGLNGYAVVSDYNSETETWVEENKFTATQFSSGGISQVNALRNATNYLYGLVNT